MDSIYDEFRDAIYMGKNQLVKRYKIVGRGSSRVVFAVDRSHVLKVPTSTKGIYQCRVEYKIYTNVNEYLKKYLCPILLLENNRLLMKRAMPLSYQHLPGHPSIFNMLDSMERNEFRRDLRILANTFDLLHNDVLSLTSWGVYNGRYVLVDYGCTNKLYDEFY